MINMFKSLITLFKTIVDFVIHLVQNLITFLTMIPKFATKIFEFIEYMPSWLIAFFIAGVSILIVKAILGRD